ncbi:MAG TPA: hypothetical protein VFQ11_06725 [Nocardioidaceae bacterium]|jgi:hypothetical protein|nr:hypothetical protein [Nocardioidaceae bacterium]
MTRPIDLLAVAGAMVAAGTTALYVVIVQSQDAAPAGWVVVVLVGGAVGAAYASHRSAPKRRQVLAVSAGLLGVLGLAAILSIGPLILLASGLCLAALLRSPGAVPGPAAHEPSE